MRSSIGHDIGERRYLRAGRLAEPRMIKDLSHPQRVPVPGATLSLLGREVE